MHARALFESTTLETLRAWIVERRQEDLHLDFKNLGSMERDGKKTLATALSGFSNADGGLLVWGIDARKDEAGIDAASELRPIPNAAATLSRLQEFTGQATSPIVDGVLHRMIPVGDDGAAVIITFVPMTESGPYQAKFGENRYYKRSGGSFYPAEHYELEDMFGRRQRPSLTFIIARTIPNDGGEIVSFTFMNEGRAIARHIGFMCDFGPGVRIPSGGSVGRSKFVIESGGIVHYADSEAILHPIPLEHRAGSCGLYRAANSDLSTPLPVTLRWYCENMRPRLFSGAVDRKLVLSGPGPWATGDLNR